MFRNWILVNQILSLMMKTIIKLREKMVKFNKKQANKILMVWWGYKQTLKYVSHYKSCEDYGEKTFDISITRRRRSNSIDIILTNLWPRFSSSSELRHNYGIPNLFGYILWILKYFCSSQYLFKKWIYRWKTYITCILL